MALQDSWSLIVGVSGGMGAATARTLAEQGGNVIGVDGGEIIVA